MACISWREESDRYTDALIKVPAGRCYTYPVFGERADVTGTWILTQFKEELSNIKFSQKWNEPLCKVVSSLVLETFEPSWIEERLKRFPSSLTSPKNTIP